MAIPENIGQMRYPKRPRRDRDFLKLTQPEFCHVIAVLTEDVVALAENTANKLIRDAIIRDYQTEFKDGVYWVPMPHPPSGIREDRKLSVSFKVYFDMDDILKARTRKLRDRREGARHLILEVKKNDRRGE
jgi:hypothetical protein